MCLQRDLETHLESSSMPPTLINLNRVPYIHRIVGVHCTNPASISTNSLQLLYYNRAFYSSCTHLLKTFPWTTDTHHTNSSTRSNKQWTRGPVSSRGATIVCMDVEEVGMPAVLINESPVGLAGSPHLHGYLTSSCENRISIVGRHHRSMYDLCDHCTLRSRIETFH